MKRAFAVLAALSFATFAAPALAEKTAVSELPIMPAPKDSTTPPKVYGVPGLTITEHQVARSTYYEAAANTKQGYCIVEDLGLMSLTDSSSSTSDMELWHFTEKDGAASLERTRYEMVDYLENAWPKSKTSVALHAVANEAGVTVWSMRLPSGDLVFLAKGAEGGREGHLGRKSEDGGEVGGSSSSCSFGATRIDAATVTHGGGIAQLNGSLPSVGEGKDKVVPRFTVDISALRVSRDPEPMITVHVRVRNF